MSAEFKGGSFVNRYLIKAVLTAKAPFHIGIGQRETRSGLAEKNGRPLDIDVSLVATDDGGKAYLPGSSIRGALRDWLKENYSCMTEELSRKIKDKKITQPNINTDDLLSFIHQNASKLEKIFGTTENEGKLEVWDAYCLTNITDPTEYNGVGWKKDRLTYVAKSVAINPETGTAEEGKLYNYELVPTGARFAVTFSAQNLSPVEAALLLKVLNGFKHSLNPITLGAMGKLGFGVFDITDFEIYCLKEGQRGDWRQLSRYYNLAGYDSIARPYFRIDESILTVKELPEVKVVKKHIEPPLKLKLETPMVVRNGSHFVWKNASHPKTRNYEMTFDWGRSEKNNSEQQVSDLNYSLLIDENNTVIPYYHVPSSSVRGAFRSWAIKSLLPKAFWNIEGYIKAGNFSNKPDYFDEILNLFGFAIEGADKNISEKYTKTGRLTLRVYPFTGKDETVDVDGSWLTHDTKKFGPDNVKRHVKPRNPLDRITNASKDGALHNVLEFSEGQTFEVKVEILDCDEIFDIPLLERLKEEIDRGMFRIGGLSGIGRGRVSRQEAKDGQK